MKTDNHRFTSEKALVHHVARCQTCDAKCDARNALAWAHIHTRHHGHVVELSMGWRVAPVAQVKP